MRTPDTEHMTPADLLQVVVGAVALAYVVGALVIEMHRLVAG